MSDYSEAMRFIGSFSKSGAPLSDLSRIEALLNRLGRPQDGLRFIHIAGTNGKGSTLEMISTALAHSGLRVGQFTSPYIRCFEDRIRINGKNIPKEALCRLCERVRQAATPECSQFEISLAIALLFFREEGADPICLEVGIGGLLDATNIIESPLVSVITSVSLDHTALLGGTVEEIAVQKGGIIKPQCPVVLSAQNGESVRDVISKLASERSAPLFLADKAAPSVGMRGAHQVFNAQTAAAALELLKKVYRLDDEDIANGIANAAVAGRFELISAAPDVFYDGAHNSDGLRVLRAEIEKLRYPCKIGIIAMQSCRSENALLLLGLFDEIICTDGFMGAESAQALAELFTENGENASALPSGEVLSAARRVVGENGAVFVCGSLYTYSLLFE